ncbi:MAG: hypothetical protein E4G99_00520 [Anaerolineales bacterium]|nr:MAG: hypothetical protein E4G99_00520 [Anaerolineales bacterium]
MTERRILGRWYLWVGGVVIATAIVAMVLILRSYQTSVLAVDRIQDTQQVWIDHPLSESTWMVEDQIQVKAMGESQTPLVKMELWIDGELAGLDTGPEEPLAPWKSVFTWTPLHIGFHALVVRAEDDHGMSITSPAVVVFVEPSEKYLAGDLVTENDGVFNTLSVYPGVDPNSREASTNPIAADQGPAILRTGSVRDLVTSLTVESPPNSPGLTVEMDGCNANLYVHDQSSTEEGFFVYRQTLSSPVWTRLATLASQSEHEWLTFEDAHQVGGVTYYVSAFNSKGESSSPLQTVSFDPVDCEDQSESSHSVEVEIMKLETQVQVDRAYCYRSFNGLDWSRWPNSGFFTPGEDGFDLDDRASSFLPTSLGDDLNPQSLEFHLECWGWRTGVLEFLGILDPQNLDLKTDGIFSFEGGVIRADVAIRSGFRYHQPTLNLNNWADLSDLTFRLMHSRIGLDTLGRKVFYHYTTMPTERHFPYIQAWLTYRKEECFNHLEPESQIAFGTLFLCSPLAGHNEGPGGVAPQAYIVWKFKSTCPAGSYEDCLPITWWKDWIEEHMREAYVEIWAEDNYRNWLSYHDEIDRTVTRVDPQNCTDERRFRVRIVINRGQDQTLPTAAIETIVSPWSNWVHGVRCRKPLGEEVLMEVTFDSIQWSHVDDNDTGPEIIETYGGLWAGTSQTPGVVPYGIVWGPRNIGTDYHLQLVDYGEPLYTEDFRDGVADMASRTLCLEIVENPGFECIYENYGGSGNPFFTVNNNKFFIPVRGGDAILFDVSIKDYDHASADDRVCNIQRWTPTRTLTGWASEDGAVFQMHQPDNGNASCTVTLLLRAVSQ